ncbi:MAG: hypothetical protein K0Q79_1794 [Flavipsychrobacter sp.]|jgi:hypothetical protein|nr:hypothetical protein [Flavipsychrobacter sp.]
MIAVILIFAFIMSLVINLIERMIIHHNRQAKENKPGEALLTEKRITQES